MRMRRRQFILGLAMLADVGRASAEDRARRVGALVVEPGIGNVLEMVFKEKEWIVNRNLQIEYRITGGDTNLSRAYARELIALQPDVLFAASNTSMAALYAEHSNIPTVFAMVSDPVGMHYVESFSSPGGNVTGFTPFEPTLGGKWASLLKEAAPNVEHIGIVYNPEPGNNSSAFRKSIDEVASDSAGQNAFVARLLASRNVLSPTRGSCPAGASRCASSAAGRAPLGGPERLLLGLVVAPVLTTNSNSVGAWTGNSAGLAPRKMRSM
jgi:hypothetical protein